MLKTLHDVALGFFINAGYGITQGGDILANAYVIVSSVTILYITNRRLSND